MPIYGFLSLEVDRHGVQFRFQGPERLLDPPQAMADPIYLLRLHLGFRGNEQVVPHKPQVFVHFALVDCRHHYCIVENLALVGHCFERYVPCGIAGKTVQVADKGLNCAKNICEALKNGDGYIFSLISSLTYPMDLTALWEVSFFSLFL